MTTDGWDAVVLAGGASRRMGQTDKLACDVGGQPMLDRVVTAVASARQIIVVGPSRPLVASVTWCREEPPGAGPAAALQAGLARVTADVVVVVAGDQPMLTAAFVETLRAAVRAEGAVAVDETGHPQWLCSAWPSRLLRQAPLRADGSMRKALESLPWTPVPCDGNDVFDCDTVEDLQRAREWAE